MADTRPKNGRCPIGSLGAHSYNAEDDECIWCGPNLLAWGPGHWVQFAEGEHRILPAHQAWSGTPPFEYGPGAPATREKYPPEEAARLEALWNAREPGSRWWDPVGEPSV